ncbi:hypothetical protein ACFVUS_00285 [Nocardia sp. NPDC058058]|uniref:hypothetical protein n=1 Tax=Nocardia sp. NPDC058058 TaxID=3346317 RepID=UPI0036DB5093
MTRTASIDFMHCEAAGQGRIAVNRKGFGARRKSSVQNAGPDPSEIDSPAVHDESLETHFKEMVIMVNARSRALAMFVHLGESARRMKARHTLTADERHNLRAGCHHAAVHTAALGGHSYL